MVQIHPPQPKESISYADSRAYPKLPLAPNSRNRRFFGRFAAVQDHLYNLAVGLTLTVRHGLPVNVDRGLDAGVPHQLLLDGERRAPVSSSHDR